MKKGEFISQNKKVMANDQTEETFMTQTGEDSHEFEFEKLLGTNCVFLVNNLSLCLKKYKILGNYENFSLKFLSATLSKIEFKSLCYKNVTAGFGGSEVNQP